MIRCTRLACGTHSARHCNAFLQVWTRLSNVFTSAAAIAASGELLRRDQAPFIASCAAAVKVGKPDMVTRLLCGARQSLVCLIPPCSLPLTSQLLLPDCRSAAAASTQPPTRGATCSCHLRMTWSWAGACWHVWAKGGVGRGRWRTDGWVWLDGWLGATLSS